MIIQSVQYLLYLQIPGDADRLIENKRVQKAGLYLPSQSYSVILVILMVMVCLNCYIQGFEVKELHNSCFFIPLKSLFSRHRQNINDDGNLSVN